ncbi:MAG: hypothetical protein AAF244_05165 [Pseudomonadota bacterium]
MSAYQEARKADRRPRTQAVTIPDEFLPLARAFEAQVSTAYAEHAKANAKENETPSTISIEVTNIQKTDKPRVSGDLRITFKITSGTIRTGKNLVKAVASAADSEGMPRSVSTMGEGFVTHLKPKEHLLE